MLSALPTRSSRRRVRRKGLVVGYVQSGKTANFTGVTAKAIDAGYRLVIVLAGTLNLLRAQTQRRLDMELIGQENILRGANPDDVDTLVGIDYVGDDDNDWPEVRAARRAPFHPGSLRHRTAHHPGQRLQEPRSGHPRAGVRETRTALGRFTIP